MGIAIGHNGGTRTRVVLADDHTVLREGIAALINAQGDLTVVGEAADAQSAIALCGELKPDVAVMDLSMPGGGLSAIEHIACEGLTRVLVLTMHDEPEYLHRVLAAGGAGYLIKTAASADLLEAVRRVAAGESFIRISVGYEGLRPVARPESPVARGDLSPRENEVLHLLARGFTNREIAERLGVRKKTVDTYRNRLQDKLGLSTRAELFAYVEQGLATRREAR